MNRILSIYKRLYNAYGELGWWPADSPFEVMVGAILTQNTNWRNVEKALVGLDGHLTPQRIREMDQEQLKDAIRPSGFYNQKTERLLRLAHWLEQYEDDLERINRKSTESLRQELLAINGIGRETADCILVYVFHRCSFVIDAYTRRIFERLGFNVPRTYDAFRQLIEEAIPKEVDIYNRYHGLIVECCKQHCRKTPLCEMCPLREICAYAKEKEGLI